jgi:hypothetical protein
MCRALFAFIPTGKVRAESWYLRRFSSELVIFKMETHQQFFSRVALNNSDA